MLTSAQAIALMKEKVQKKEEEKLAKEARKKEREGPGRGSEEESIREASKSSS